MSILSHLDDPLMSINRSLPSAMPMTVISPFMQDPTRLMPEPMKHGRPHETTLDWFATAERVGRTIDLDASAHAHGAMLRRRGVPSATNLLCLAFLYGPARMPLRLIAERAAATGIAKVSEPALLRRLMNATPWLEHLADTLIVQQLDRIGGANGRGAEVVKLRSSMPLTGGPFASMPLYDHRVRMANAAKRFIIDFEPWPLDLFSDAQVHWLLCVRWTYVASSLKEGPLARIDSDPNPATLLETSRQMAQMIAAAVSRDN